MKNLTPHRYLNIISGLILFVMSPLLYAQTYTELHNFDWHKEGANPLQPALLAQGLDASLNGTLQTQLFHDGSVFSYQLGGTLLDLYDFTGKPDGNTPQSGLSLGWDGNFYGTTVRGGTSDKGTVFKFRDGVKTILYNFTDGADGAFPWAPPIQAPDGNIYGVTFNGTTPGTAYKITPSGVFSVIANLPSKTVAPLILGTDGNLYGTTQNGGTFNQGTGFQLTTKGKLKIIYSFGASGNDGKNPGGPVVQAADGKLYGTTAWGGANGIGTVFAMSTSGGGYKVLHNFQTLDGVNPGSGMVQGSDKFLYSVAASGGANGVGTIFKINTTGTTFSVLYNFNTQTGGYTPTGTPTLHTNGLIYGLTTKGGSQLPLYGTLYSYNAGLNPFASLVVIWSGHVGDSIGLLGQGFSSATGVSFGNGPGQFVAISDTAMIASPAPGAMTGPVKVHEPGGDLVTPQTFKVLPSISDFTPKSGPVGTVVTITGMSLKQTKSVTIGKVVQTTFTVVSDTQVTTTVPLGAVTGKVSLKTTGGTAIARGLFTVQ